MRDRHLAHNTGFKSYRGIRFSLLDMPVHAARSCQAKAMCLPETCQSVLLVPQRVAHDVVRSAVACRMLSATLACTCVAEFLVELRRADVTYC
jgi:hypothetical protein